MRWPLRLLPLPLALLGLACGEPVTTSPDAGQPAGDGGVISDAGSGDAAASDSAPVGDAHAADVNADIDHTAPDSNVGADAAGPDAGSPDATPSTDAGTQLRLWTYNLLNPSNPMGGGDDVDERTQIVIDAINADQPDLIAMQEVVDSNSVPNRAEFIAAATGYHFVWEQEYSAVIYDEGIAVLSRWPILESEAIELPHLDLILFQRKVLRAQVDAPQGPVDLYCTHMTVGGSEEQSADQAKAAFDFISARAGTTPAFFAGDLNAEPDTLSMRFLRGEESHDGTTGDLSDLWLETNPSDPGYTIAPDDPHDRIDFIYAAPSTPAAQPLSCELIFDQQVGGVWASDHIGVACDVELQ